MAGFNGLHRAYRKVWSLLLGTQAYQSGWRAFPYRFD